MTFIYLFIIICTFICYTTQFTFQKTSIPSCSLSENYDPHKRPHVAVISHDSAISTFAQNPEQGARDAAAVLDIELEWNQHFINSVSKMKADIYDAVDKGVDGIIVTIPNAEIVEAIEYAMSKNIPVLVFNAGRIHAQKLGLTRVLQNNQQTGQFIARELHRRGYGRPLVVQISSFDDTTFDGRYIGISQVLGFTPQLLAATDYNNTKQSVAQVTAHLKENQDFDSIISLGGSVGIDIVSSAALDVLSQNESRRLAVAFFDTGSTDNMTALFQQHRDVFGVSQMPYYQAALPVFLMYLRILTGFDVFHNQTIETGPILVTNETLATVLENEQSTLIPLKIKDANIGVILPNAQGDTYSSAFMAGIKDLARKLNWNVWNAIEVKEKRKKIFT
ncbi:MAG: periplasmic binding protein domain-containing protein [Benjaminiella poitrasii]|nr:MAG: periplasmic binding protein domain-containing protein [Benjaminiella poitrasii]